MATLNIIDMFGLEPKMLIDAPIDERLDKEQLKMSILRRCGTLLPVYTNTELMKVLVFNFFYEKEKVISKLIDTTEFDYNPISNYDKTETIIRDMELSAGKGSNTTTTPNETQETSVSAFDSNEYQPKEKVNNSGTTSTEIKTNGQDTEHETTTTRTNGNIGVTTTQKLINEERKVALFNVYEWIAIEFECNFCILIS